MIKVSILYPNTNSVRFDFEYYQPKHMSRSIDLLSRNPGFRFVTVERGIGGTEPGSPPKYVAVCFYVFATVDASIAAFMPHAFRVIEKKSLTEIPKQAASLA